MKFHLRKILTATVTVAGGFLAISTFAIPAAIVAAEEKPNFVLVFTDDQGYGDLGCYGSETIRTPNIDRLAAEGRRFTSFVVASPVCTPSRAALLTGCYPKRVGMHRHVLFPSSDYGLNPEEHTIADHLTAQGYATACFGKWHLGHHPETLPRANGFGAYFGIPYSNDMNHPDNKGKPKGGPAGMDILWNNPESTLTKWNTPLIENEEIVELPVDQRTITRRTTDRAVEFIEKHRDQPFFLYLPRSMPHIPLYVPDDVRDPDPKRAYINTIEHIDTETGRVFDKIRELGLSEKTYVIYTTDNGPWLSFKHHGGSAGPLRGGKGTTFEGGQRVPFIISRPGTIPAGTVCDELAASIDLLPTFAALTGTPLPETARSTEWTSPPCSPRTSNHHVKISSIIPLAVSSRAFARAIGNCSKKGEQAGKRNPRSCSSTSPKTPEKRKTSPPNIPTSSKTSDPACANSTPKSPRTLANPGAKNKRTYGQPLFSRFPFLQNVPDERDNLWSRRTDGPGSGGFLGRSWFEPRLSQLRIKRVPASPEEPRSPVRRTDIPGKSLSTRLNGRGSSGSTSILSSTGSSVFSSICSMPLP